MIVVLAFTLILLQSCYACPPNCNECNLNLLNTCNSCSSGYSLIYESCYQCLANCDSCTSTYLCNVCSSGYSLTSDGTSCYSSLSSGVTVAIIMCSVFGPFIIFCIIFCCCKNCRNSQSSNNNDGGATEVNIYRDPPVSNI